MSGDTLPPAVQWLERNLDDQTEIVVRHRPVDVMRGAIFSIRQDDCNSLARHPIPCPRCFDFARSWNCTEHGRDPS